MKSKAVCGKKAKNIEKTAEKAENGEAPRRAMSENFKMKDVRRIAVLILDLAVRYKMVLALAEYLGVANLKPQKA